MTDPEANDPPPPSPAEIRERAAAIRATWPAWRLTASWASLRDFERRRKEPPEWAEWHPPRCGCACPEPAEAGGEYESP